MQQKKLTLTKPMGITLFTVVMLIMAAVIVFYRNPLAEPSEEMVKKIIASVKTKSADGESGKRKKYSLYDTNQQ